MVGEPEKQKEPSYMFILLILPMKLKIFTIFYWQLAFDLILGLMLVAMPASIFAMLF
jgi:hypothetical protein